MHIDGIMSCIVFNCQWIVPVIVSPTQLLLLHENYHIRDVRVERYYIHLLHHLRGCCTYPKVWT
jgi:hypothetical protein